MNTIKFTQVIKIALIAVAFAVISPVIVLADDYYDTSYNYSDVSSNYPDMSYNYPDVSYNNPDVSYNYPDVSYNNPDVSYNYPDVSYNYPDVSYNNPDVSYNSNVTSGSYNYGYGGYSNYGNYYIPISSQVTSGSFSGGTTYVTPSTYYINPPSTVTTGSFSGGTNYVADQTYYVNPASTVTSGSYSSVSPSYSYTQPTPYYNQPTLQVVPNQVLAYTDTNPNLDSVYLSDVPYTGFEDYYGSIIFISVLLSWSAILAYVFLKRKIEAQTANSLAYVNKIETNDVSNSATSDFMNQIVSDNTDISKVEEYARMNKVLLSSDASIKLVKLSRLGQIRVSDFIRDVATGEWIAVGENQICKTEKTA